MKSAIQRKIPLKVGIIGGGQLARMLILEGFAFGLEMHVFSEKNTDPAAQVTSFWTQGAPLDTKALYEFCKKLDLVTFESEFHQMDTFLQLQESETINFFPSPQNLQILQHRKTQKELLQAFQIPTADFISVENLDDLLTANKKFKGKFVLKKNHGGYDGYGTLVVKNRADLEKAKSLLHEKYIAEEFIPFRRELALVAVRSNDGTKSGSFISLPLVETKQVDNRCDWICGPLTHPQVSKQLVKIEKMLKKIDYVGAIAFEFFEIGSELLVNEVAPRVHNTAHYSQNALSCSQFLYHLKAGLGLKLEDPEILSSAFAMVNLIGQGVRGTEDGTDNIEFPTNFSGHLHWYGKQISRRGRKMGHLNYLGSSAKKLVAQGLNERKRFKL